MAEMDMKEKLVELKKVLRECLHFNYDEFSCDMSLDVDLTAENLIAHGVTVQEWISVEDKLPQNFVSVLGYMTDAGEFPPVRECYTVGNAFFFPALGDIHPVSHWMPLPEPPKEVE